MRLTSNRGGLRLVLSLFVLGGVMSSGRFSTPSARTSDPCAMPAPNPVACENALPGSPASEWDVEGAGSESIQGFASSISVNRSQTIEFRINTPATAYRLDIYRLGYYGGNGARKVDSILPSAPLPQAQPACATDEATGLVDCGVWDVSASWLVPASAVSGVYLARLVRTDDIVGTSHVVFVVRDDDRPSDLLFQTADTTWQAHNEYGGSSLYSGGPSGRAYKVSYNRPFTTRTTSPENWLFHAEYPMIRWLEANGYDVSYTTGVDTDRLGAELLEHKAFLSAGYDEYWSGAQRGNVEAARAAGVHLAFFSAKSMFWKTRWEPSIDGSGTPYRTLVCYKETHANDKIDPQSDLWTGTWRDPRFSPPADGGRAENALAGTMFAVNGGAASAIEVPAEFGRLRFWRNTSIAALAAGDIATLPIGTLGFEWNEAPSDSRPSGLLALSRTRRTVPHRLLDYGSTFGTGNATHNLTLYRHLPNRALVFGAGTAQWSWGLDAWPDRDAASVDLRMRQGTVNLLADMGSQPATPQPDLILSTMTDDVGPPISTILSPTAGALLARGAPVTIQGTATDAAGAVALVEVSTDGGSTWATATGTTNWTFEWTPTTAGAAVLHSRAYDDDANMEVPGPGVAVMVTAPASGACPCTIWNPDAVPPTPDAGPDYPVELGVKFEATARGYITGIRFFKSAANTGTHIGNLWTSTGTHLARATFTGESASGWQTATFDAPVAVEPNKTYIASYHTTVGHYSFSAFYFASRGVENGPLRALANAASVNGVYRYTPSSAFPHSSYLAANYWVDVVFVTNASDSTAPTILNTAPSADAVVAPSASITVTFDEPLDATTVSAATFELRDSENDLVPSAISYVSSSNRAVLTPSAPLDHLRAYSAHVRGGAGGVTDLAGNPLAADYAWTFNTGAQGTTSPDVGPGGPILVVSAPGNPFSRYYAEILRAEGLNAFAVMDVSDVTLATLADYDVVVLGNIPLTSTHVTMFTTWVNGGGRLIAMRPDKQLASLLGLDDAGAVLSDQYLMMDTASGPGAGLVAQTIQFHGEADLYTVSGATALATLYSSATESASRPAVTLRHVGSRGGQAAAFTYDLARSVVYTRQGNPAWAGQERDGTSPVRATDMFWGGGTAPDWVDLSKVAIPQADEQQRLLANLILQMNVRRRPLPRFWYLPRGAKAAVVMTGDEHGNGGTVARFEAFLASSAAGCSVDDWECVRASSYVYPTTLLSREDARALDDQGFEIGIHVNTGCADFTATSVNTSFATQITQWSSKYSTLRSPSTTRTHCIPWSDWSSHVLASARNGIRLDTNYYYWPAAWAANSPGLFTGSGMPMRFADQTGAMLDVYQATTQITDESGQFVPATINALLNRALGPEGYYGVFTANMHNDLAVSWGAGAIVEAAQTRGVPIVSARQMLEWLDGRNASSYRNLSWNGTVLSFRIERGAGARGLMAMVPGAVGSMHVGSITADGTPIAFTHQTIKGVAYVTFPVASAVYHVTYAAPPGTEEESLRLRGTVTAADTHSPLANVTVSVFHANGTLAASAISDALGAYRTGPVGLGAYYVRTSNQQSYVDEAFSGIACRPDCVVTAGTPIEVTGEPIAPIDFALAPVKAAMIYPAANAIGVVLTRNFEWTPVPLADAYILHIGTAPNTWDVLAAGLLTQPSFRVTTTLPTDRTLYTRVGARVAGVWRFAESIPFTAASTRPSLVYPTANATDVLLTRDFEWTPVPGADAYILYVGTAAGTWDVLAAGLLTHHTYRVAALPIDRQLYATVGARVGGVWRFGTSVPFTAARMTAALRYPTANAAGVLLTRDFEWTPVPGADAYILHIGTAPNTWDVLAAGLLTQPSFRVTTTLPADRTLYTRVGSRLGGVWRFGETVAFTAAPVIPTLLYPAANATEVMLTRNFEWTSVPGADAYILHIGTTPNGWNLVAVGLLTQPTYHVTAILPSDRTLYVRAGARVGGLWRFSDSVPFTAARAVASLLYPIENATDVVLTRNFEWTPVPGGDAYILHIGTAPNTWDVLAAGLLTDVSYHVTQTLPSDRTLYARVATRLGGIWRFGPTTAFTAARRTPALLYPTANATGVVATRDFEWTPVPGADAYILHIGTAPNTWDVVAAGLLPGTTYRVTTTLPTDRPLYARVGARLGGIWRFADSILFNAAPQ